MKKLLMVVLMATLLVGCSQKEVKVSQKLTIGVMPSLDSAPIIWADTQGLFKEAGLDVELIVYTNGNDRDTQVQTGAVDAVVTDIMGLVAMREAGYKVQGVSETQTLFSVVSQVGAMSKDTLKLGMAEVSVTQYMADAGLKNYKLEKVFIDALPQRLEMVGQGLLDGSVIPEPMASLSTLKGLEVAPIEATSPNVLMFQESTLKDKSAEVTVFYKVYNEAVDAMKANEDTLKTVVAETLGLDAAIVPVMKFPEYTHAKTVDNTVYEDVVAWMKTTLDMDSSVSYSDAIATGILK